MTKDASAPAAEPDAALDLRNISKRFGDTQALRDVSLQVRTGDIVCLVGASGCGKSSLLRVIAGLETPDSGALFMDGREIVGPSRFLEPEARHIGFVFQDYALFPHLTVRENILFGLKRRKSPDAALRAAEIIEHVGIGRLADRYPHMLSGGEQQRVAMARALAPDPHILLMDEPFSNLDRGLRESLRDDTLALLRTRGTTAIMVTHDPEEALSAGDTVVLMKGGAIVQTGSGYDLHDRPASRYAADFFCDFNRLPGTYRNGAIETAIGRFPCSLSLADGSAALAYLRPHEILAADGADAIDGQIIGRLFLGEVEQLTVQIVGLPEPLRVRTTRRTVSGNDRIRLTIPRTSVLGFAET